MAEPEVDLTRRSLTGEELPFYLDDLEVERTRVVGSVVDRDGQARFRFEVMKAYGRQCAVCEVTADDLLEAAHLKDRAKRGTNDRRNGLPLCRNHHRAFDRGLFGIEPQSLGVMIRKGGPAAADLGITRADLGHLGARPHGDALGWAWERKFGSMSGSGYR